MLQTKFHNTDFLFRKIVNNNKQEVLNNAIKKGFIDTGEDEDLIVFIKQKSKNKKELKEIIDVEILPNRLSNSDKNEFRKLEKIVRNSIKKKKYDYK